VTASVAVVVGIRGTLTVPLAAVMLGLAARVAWIRAPERAARSGTPPKLVRGPAWYALTVVHGLRLLRQDAVALVCWVSLAIGTGLIAALVVHNRGGVADTDPAVIVLVAATLPLVLVSGTACQRVLDNERRLRWVLDVTGTSRGQRHAAAAVAVSAIAAFTAILVGATAAFSARWSAQITTRCLLSCTVWGVSLGLLLIALGRRVLRDRPKDVARHSLGAAVFGVTTMALMGLLGEETAYAALGLAIVVSLRVAQPQRTEGSVTDSSLLSIDSVSKRVGGKRVLSDVGLTLRAGEACALVGANGAGKSTLLRIVVGVTVPDSGEIRVAGLSLRTARVAALADVGYAPEHADFPDYLRASEWLAMVAALKGLRRHHADQASPLGLSAFAEQRLGTLSLGQQRRVALAAGLVGTPRLLVLDEPTNGLDTASLGEIADLISAQLARGGSVLFATHDAAFAGQVGARRIRVEDGCLLDIA
jgi:ABC-2 type transport system ATP-binding protein